MRTSKLFVVSEPEHPKRVENLCPNAARLLLASANRKLMISEEKLRRVICFVPLIYFCRVDQRIAWGNIWTIWGYNQSINMWPLSLELRLVKCEC